MAKNDLTKNIRTACVERWLAYTVGPNQVRAAAPGPTKTAYTKRRWGSLTRGTCPLSPPRGQARERKIGGRRGKQGEGRVCVCVAKKKCLAV